MNQQRSLLVTAGYDQTIRVWNHETAACSRLFQHEKSVSLTPWLIMTLTSRCRALKVISGLCSKSTAWPFILTRLFWLLVVSCSHLLSLSPLLRPLTLTVWHQGYQRVSFYKMNSDDERPVVVLNKENSNLLKNIVSIGYESSGSWVFTASEDKTVRLWDMR